MQQHRCGRKHTEREETNVAWRIFVSTYLGLHLYCSELRREGVLHCPCSVSLFVTTRALKKIAFKAVTETVKSLSDSVSSLMSELVPLVDETFPLAKVVFEPMLFF